MTNYNWTNLPLYLSVCVVRRMLILRKDCVTEELSVTRGWTMVKYINDRSAIRPARNCFLYLSADSTETDERFNKFGDQPEIRSH